jgi:hypothetical protein
MGFVCEKGMGEGEWDMLSNVPFWVEETFGGSPCHGVNGSRLQ